MLEKLKRIFIGSSRDPFDPSFRENVALIAFLAWIGIGADGLSSSIYGPEEAFKALGQYHELGPFLAIASAITVFIIALGYNQVIELFPSGGGGYKVATKLLGPYPGLVSGSALLIDYVLTITISIAACVDAIWSLFIPELFWLKIPIQTGLIVFLMMLNLRGFKEPIVLLAPIFVGFLITHAALIIGGIYLHADGVPFLLPNAADAFHGLTEEVGWIGALAFALKAYTLSAGTYTGIEAVSNNVHLLAKPRIKTGKLTMMYMAFSLAFAAAGVTIIYQLWTPDVLDHHKTLNAIAFEAILVEFFGNNWFSHSGIIVVLALEGLLLMVAANAGFLGGPSVLANMAADRWAPHAFSQLSTRLVTQNGILTMGIAAIAILWITGGNVSLLVVLYSLNVFITFTLSLMGLLKYRLENFQFTLEWITKLILAFLGFILCSCILLLMITEKFNEGAWATILVTTAVVIMFVMIRQHYVRVQNKLKEADILLHESMGQNDNADPLIPENKDRIAVILVGRSLGAGIHEMLTVTRLFPGIFHGFIFVSVGEVDMESFSGEESLSQLKDEVENVLDTLVKYCWARGFKADYEADYGVDVVQKLATLCDKIRQDFSNTIFFSTQLVFDNDTAILRMLHNQTSVALQRRLHLKGIPMMVLPMKI